MLVYSRACVPTKRASTVGIALSRVVAEDRELAVELRGVLDEADEDWVDLELGSLAAVWASKGQ